MSVGVEEGEGKCNSYPPLPQLESVVWRYDMRREMQEIVPNLYLGPYASAKRSNYEVLKQVGITHIVCVRQFIERKYIYPNFPNEFEYLIVEMADDLFERIIPQCKVVCDFLKNCLESGGKALVHGNGGASRSAALVIAFIMARYGLTAQEAHRYVQLRRFCINPNDNFVAQLREFEPIYRAYDNTTHSTDLEPRMTMCGKRTREMRDADNPDEIMVCSSPSVGGSNAIRANFGHFSEDERMTE